MKILIADDSRVMRQIVVRTLRQAGFGDHELIEAVRPQLERNHRRHLSDRLFREMIFQLFPYPNRLRLAALFGVVYEKVGGRRRLVPFGRGPGPDRRGSVVSSRRIGRSGRPDPRERRPSGRGGPSRLG